MSGSKQDYVKQRTIELYDSLPQDEELRKQRLDVRDEVIELNYSFFGYVATHTFINNTSVTYEDKFQSALLHFCECWWWYKYAAKYRTDLSFAVFFKPRLGEMIERELNEVKYSVRRSLCMEAGKQLNKHWAQVKYDDLSHVDLPADKLNSLKAIFGTLYWADIESHEMFIEAPAYQPSIYDNLNDNYNDIESLLIHELVENETPLTDVNLVDLGELYGISYADLKLAYPGALKKLYNMLKTNQDLVMS